MRTQAMLLAALMAPALDRSICHRLRCLPLQVSGQQLMPFTEDKQTVLLVALRNAYQTVNAPLVCLNVTDWQTGSGSARK